MRIVIATTGALQPEPVAQFARLLVGPDGIVFVVTVIEVPRSFLDEIRADHWHPLSDGTPEWATQEDAVIARYVEERGGRLTEPLTTRLETLGIDMKVMFLEGEDPAGTIIAAAEDVGADLIILGATRALFDETHWESVSARVLREARLPVLVVPAGPPQNGEESA